MRFALLVLLVGGAFGGGALVGSRFFAPDAPVAAAPAAPRLEVPRQATARSAHEEKRAAFLGVVLSGNTVDLAPKFSGRVLAVLAQPGTQVTRGSPLAQIDSQELRMQLRIAQEALAEANRTVARNRRLSRIGAVSREDLSRAKVTVLERQARVNEVMQSISDAELRAPFDGVVATRYMDPGALSGPDRPVLRLIGKDQPRVRFAVPEPLPAELHEGARVMVRVQGAEFHGVVESLSPEVDTAARMIYVLARLKLPEKSDTRLSSGSVARVTMDRIGGSPVSTPGAPPPLPATDTAAQ